MGSYRQWSDLCHLHGTHLQTGWRQARRPIKNFLEILTFSSSIKTYFFGDCNFAFFSGLIDAQFWASCVESKSSELTANYC
ncbi:hypothetical protein D5Z32_18195 [Escherichia coli]|nr:hypothetical protein [Escherichia coli]EFA4412665.1 hypothetical protein [Escherichia coli]EFA4424963.1 hypothetical protein [Escherichia coli]EFB2934893.1 hypothetical protein [Escherichia coli]EFI3620721.1 hypothetical protein [Escherichia coli]